MRDLVFWRIFNDGFPSDHCLSHGWIERNLSSDVYFILLARLENFLKEEEAFVNELRSCITKFKESYTAIERFGLRPDLKKGEELIVLRSEVAKAFNEALKKESKAEHEKSHLLESYAGLILALEEGKKQSKAINAYTKKKACASVSFITNSP